MNEGNKTTHYPMGAPATWGVLVSVDNAHRGIGANVAHGFTPTRYELKDRKGRYTVVVALTGSGGIVHGIYEFQAGA
ncbi:hypothetical protein [Streptomyces johnsoniae]|uniref:Uncharacterized protein n=1 Tax=Streptomyces johnsoniae TaxID=3075532 RepID=A0ABU2S000_9ACTN|nr:hypothetical protein [Streptomyces sp. DSM 41886]MDT0442302.1 hypothetical protein [Streptomyces sp. DSM 41886]